MFSLICYSYNKRENKKLHVYQTQRRQRRIKNILFFFFFFLFIYFFSIFSFIPQRQRMQHNFMTDYAVNRQHKQLNHTAICATVQRNNL